MPGTDILCVGELLVDFISEDGENFQKKAGGAPANVAVAASRLGANVDLAATVGKDFLGNFLISKMREEEIGTEKIRRCRKNTTMALVQLSGKGEPEFSFVRGADVYINPEQISGEYDILHLGSLPFTSKKTSSYIIEELESTDSTVSFDPNIREELRTEGYIERLKSVLEHTDIIFATEPEIEELGGRENLEDKIDEIIITRGEEGAELVTENNAWRRGVESIEPVDTTGAGDALAGAYLAFREEGKQEALEKGLEASKECIKHKGAMESLPHLKDLD